MTSGGNNFNDFPENQLTRDFGFFASLLGGTLLYHCFPLSYYHLGNDVPQKILGGTVARPTPLKSTY